MRSKRSLAVWDSALNTPHYSTPKTSACRRCVGALFFWRLVMAKSSDLLNPKNELRCVNRLLTIRRSAMARALETFTNHVTRRLLPHHRRILAAIPKDGGSRSAISDTSILLKCHREHPNVHKDVFGRMAWDSQAPTLTGRCTDVYNGRFAHPDQDRGISLREAAALQTFADNYTFFGTYFNIAQQIGNAVPVALARRLGRAAIDSL